MLLCRPPIVQIIAGYNQEKRWAAKKSNVIKTTSENENKSSRAN